MSGCGSAYAPACLKPGPGRTLDRRSQLEVSFYGGLIPERRRALRGLTSMVKPIVPAAPTSTVVEREFIPARRQCERDR